MVCVSCLTADRKIALTTGQKMYEEHNDFEASDGGMQ